MKIFVVTMQNQDEFSDLLSVNGTEEGAKSFIDNFVSSEKPYHGAVWTRETPEKGSVHPENWKHVHFTPYPWTHVYYEEKELAD